MTLVITGPRVDEVGTAAVGVGRALNVERVTTAGQFAALAGPWEALRVEAGASNPFLAHDWLARWWQAYAPGRQLWTILARDPQDGNRLVGAAPLVLERARLGARRLTFMGAGEAAPNHLDLLAAPAHRDAFARAAAESLRATRGRWDVLELLSLAGDAPTSAAFLAALGAAGMPPAVSPFARCPYATLPATYDEYLKGRGAKLRAQLRSKEKKLLQDFADVRFGRVESEAELGPAFDAFVRLHQGRWAARGELGAFANPALVEFHRAFARDALRRDALRLYHLRVGGEFAAAFHCFRDGPRVFYYNAGFDERWAKYSVGVLILGHAIERSIAEGATELDFLQGEEGYKEHWMTGCREDVRVRAAAPGPRGRFARWHLQSADRARDLWRGHVPAGIRLAVKQRLWGIKAGKAASARATASG